MNDMLPRTNQELTGEESATRARERELNSQISDLKGELENTLDQLQKVMEEEALARARVMDHIWRETHLRDLLAKERAWTTSLTEKLHDTETERKGQVAALKAELESALDQVKREAEYGNAARARVVQLQAEKAQIQHLLTERLVELRKELEDVKQDYLHGKNPAFDLINENQVQQKRKATAEMNHDQGRPEKKSTKSKGNDDRTQEKGQGQTMQETRSNQERHFWCKRCHRDHPGKTCNGQLVECYNCGKRGHRKFECRQGVLNKGPRMPPPPAEGHSHGPGPSPGGGFGLETGYRYL